MNEIIQARLTSYKAANDVESENAMKEIIQEIALYGLWRAKFFEIAVFQGGTSLRILHNLPRFSEDLDFMLLTPNPEFDWEPYLKVLIKTFEEYGLQPEASSKKQMDKRIRNAVIKDNSIVNQLDLSVGKGNSRQLLKVKLEIDVHPPEHSVDNYSYLDFPVDYEIRHQDLSSNFALKTHALLCRKYLKGRDWYDFAWYARQGVFPNLAHLKAALRQFGPWAEDETLSVNLEWFKEEMTKRIQSVDWDEAKRDVRRFLRPAEMEALDIWSNRFFEAKLDKILSLSRSGTTL